MARIHYNRHDYDYDYPLYKKVADPLHEVLQLPELFGTFTDKFRQVFGNGTLVTYIESASLIPMYTFQSNDGKIYNIFAYKGSYVCEDCPTLGHEPFTCIKLKGDERILCFQDYFIVLDDITYELYRKLVLNDDEYKLCQLTQTILILSEGAILPSTLSQYKQSASDYLSKWD